MRRALLGLLLIAGCGVKIDGDEQADAMPSQTDGAVDGTGVDGGDMAAVYAACMAKGYVASGALTSLYRISASSRSWVEAQAECAADVAGATHLVVLSSAAESQSIQTTLGWVGLSDRATEGTFVNVTAEPNDQRPWLPDQPDNGSGDEDCAQMKSGGLDDDQCGNAHVFVCECDGRAPTP